MYCWSLNEKQTILDRDRANRVFPKIKKLCRVCSSWAHQTCFESLTAYISINNCLVFTNSPCFYSHCRGVHMCAWVCQNSSFSHHELVRIVSLFAKTQFFDLSLYCCYKCDWSTFFTVHPLHTNILKNNILWICDANSLRKSMHKFDFCRN